MKCSAGLLMFRRGDSIEVLLVHPGGPFFRNKDKGAWTIPKGEAQEDEDLLLRAQIEFEEELGVRPQAAKYIDLGSVKQKGGKAVFAWAFEGRFEDSFKCRSNTFTLEWPRHSGMMVEFPEIDRAEFFPIEVARWKINPAQIALVERLVEKLAPV